ncbi:MAG: DUF5106 domain-containing protein [Bacteroidetes bacterium]|nr:DUF5106 domain-containing protein [Bacteroidota bacterium]
MKLTRYSVFLLILILFSFSKLSGQDNYVIKFKINGKKDTTCMIAYYYSNGTYIKDTLDLDGSGRCTYKAPSDIPKGLYVFVISDKIYFDFVINNDHKFSMETNASDPTNKMVIKDSPDNQLFYQYLRYNRSKFNEIQAIQDQYKKVGEPKDSAGIYSTKINEINKELIKFKLDIVKKHPESFTAFMINAMREPEITEFPTLPDGRKDSTAAYQYYKSHFWEGVNFTDDRLLRTPVFHNKLKKYFDNIVIQQTDSIIIEIDAMIEKCRPNPEMFKYLVWFTTYTYENSEIMGFDKIFVHVVDKYYVPGQTTWITKDINEKIIKKANKIRPLLIGEKAPNMIMLDTNNQLISMHNIKAKYLMLLFWDPDCSHCKQEIPVIDTFYNENKEKYGLEIFAVCSDTSVVKWKTALKMKKMNWINVDGPRSVTEDYHGLYDIISTPVIYILNERKEIIAKRLAASKIGFFLENYIKKPRKP